MSEKKKWGDLKYATWIKDTPGLNTIMMHLWPRRTACEVYISDTIDVTEVMKYIEEENKKHPEYHTTIFHCVVTAVARMLMEREKMNYFVQGRRLYKRDEISLGFVAKRHFSDGAEESLLVLKPKETDTLSDISKQIFGDVTKERQKKSADGINQTIDSFAALPRPILMFALGIIKRLDFYGKVPSSLREGDTHYVSVLLSNLGSIHCPSVYHHLCDYGTNSIVVTIGTVHKEERVMPDGTKQERDILDIGCTIDERIADGFYFARSLKLIHHTMAHPELLEVPLNVPSGYDYES